MNLSTYVKIVKNYDFKKIPCSTGAMSIKLTLALLSQLHMPVFVLVTTVCKLCERFLSGLQQRQRGSGGCRGCSGPRDHTFMEGWVSPQKPTTKTVYGLLPRYSGKAICMMWKARAQMVKT